MKYYSRPPSETQSRLANKQETGLSRKRLSRVILLVDLVFVVLVALYFQSDIRNENKLSHIEKNLEISGLEIISLCTKRVVCHLTVSSPKKKTHIQQINWSVISTEKKSETIHATSNIQKDINQGDSYEDTFTFPLEQNRTVYVKLILESKKSIIKFQVFP